MDLDFDVLTPDGAAFHAVGEGILALLEIRQYLKEHHHVFPHAVNA
jgi:hypothetical protein